MEDVSNPFLGTDVRTLIDSQARNRASHPFLIWEPFEGQSRSWSFGDFRNAARRFGAGLEARGLKTGDRILLHFENCPEQVIAWLGCAYAGVVPVTTNAKSTSDEIAYFARHSRARAAVTQPRFSTLIRDSARQLEWIAVTDTDCGAPAKSLPAGFEPFEAVAADPDCLTPRQADPMAPFSIQYTSGTTARPKAVLWTHGNFLWGARLCAMHEGLREDDVHLTYLPLFHTNAQMYSVAASLWAGATVVLQPRFSASRFWPIALKRRCTWASIMPFCMRALQDHPVPPHHSFRLWGDGVCDPPSDAHFGVRTIGWWGMTETIAHGIVGSTLSPNTPLSLGRPSPGYEVFVLDPDGHPTPPGETGDLYLRGRRGLSLFLEYADDPDATTNAFTADGLFITGDRIRVGEDGALYFADRAKDMLKVGGENVAASEIERVILTVPGVLEVAVVGQPHSMLDEVPYAFVIAAAENADLPDRIIAACEQSLAAFKVPRGVRLVPDLPRSTLEKVAKAELRTLLVSEPS